MSCLLSALNDLLVLVSLPGQVIFFPTSLSLSDPATRPWEPYTTCADFASVSPMLGTFNFLGRIPAHCWVMM